MLGNNPFYFRTIRNMVVAFGTIFKDITLIRYAKNTFNEIDRLNVPLKYAGKEDFLTRLAENFDLHKQTQINLPVMTFEMTDIQYDPTRKLSSFLKSGNAISGSPNNASQQYQGVPYNVGFELNIYVRNVEDGTQIVEQILPFFNPDYTLSMMFVEAMNINREIPIILEDIKYENKYEGPAETTVRTLVWTLSFKMKTYFFGPISTGSIIRTATANISSYANTSSVSLTFSPGFGSYTIGEVVYQGGDLPHATTTATVTAWNPKSNVLTITNQQGTTWSTSANVIGSMSNASYGLLSYSPMTGLTSSIVVTPNPSTANIGDDFGFTTTITDYE